MALHIPSPPVNGFHVGPTFIHFYGLMYVIGIALAVIITRRRWEARGGNPALVADVATWAVPAVIRSASSRCDSLWRASSARASSRS